MNIYASQDYVDGHQPDMLATEGRPGYIKNRTHWVEEIREVIFEDERIGGPLIIDDGTTTVPVSTFVAGETYVVTVDGIEYTGIAVAGNDDSTEGGGFTIFSSYDPVYICTHGNQVYGYFEDDPAAHALKIEHIATTYHPIDPNYLPEGYPYKEEVRETIIPETSVTAVNNNGSGNWQLEINRDGYTYEPYLLHNDTRYKSVNVIYDGVLYENVPVDYVSALTNDGSGDGGIGNTAQLRETGSERDYPFAIAASSAWTQSWFEIDGAHTVEVYVTETAIHPLAPELGGVPTPTAEDEGKVLMSVNGVPTWVALTNVAQEGA